MLRLVTYESFVSCFENVRIVAESLKQTAAHVCITFNNRANTVAKRI